MTINDRHMLAEVCVDTLRFEVVAEVYIVLDQASGRHEAIGEGLLDGGVELIFLLIHLGIFKRRSRSCCL